MCKFLMNIQITDKSIVYNSNIFENLMKYFGTNKISKHKESFCLLLYSNIEYVLKKPTSINFMIQNMLNNKMQYELMDPSSCNGLFLLEIKDKNG